MTGNALWNAKGGKTLQERKPAGRSQAAQRAFMIAGSITGAVVLILALAVPACAQPYPNKTIRLIVPFPPGATDTMGRIIGQRLSERLGQPVMIDNRPGAGGMLGIEMVAKAKPDGYTLVTCGAGALAISTSLYKKKIKYDTLRDFAPISQVAETHWGVFVRASHPIKNLKELVAYARANPGKLSYGSSGIGATPHLTGELFKMVAKVDIMHVPYKGGGPAVVGLIGGEVDMQFTNVSNVLSQVQAGKARALAVLSKERLPSLPNVPTAKEEGIENFEVSGWYGLLAPAGTPHDIIDRLNVEWSRSVTMANTKEQMKNAGFDPISDTPEQFSAFLRAEIERWAKVIKDANIMIAD